MKHIVRRITTSKTLWMAAVRKRSEGKATWPGRKQVFRRYDAANLVAGDTLTLMWDRASHCSFR